MLNIRSYLENRPHHFSDAKQTPVHLASVNNRHYYAFPLESAPLGGGKHVTEAELETVKANSLLLQGLNLEAMRRIEQVMPIWKQCNSLLDLIEIPQGQKGRRSEKRTIAEEGFNRIKAIRRQANHIEQALLSGIEVDYLTDSAWQVQYDLPETAQNPETIQDSGTTQDAKTTQDPETTQSPTND